jgi:hypothetical protein
VPNTIPVTIDAQVEAMTFDDLTRLLKPYPTARGRIVVNKAVMQLDTLPTRRTPSGTGIDVLFQGDLSALDEAAPQYRIAERRWLRPAVTGDSAPTPLMTWWALLYALSMYSRYYPEEWIAALSIDSSEAAVTLERAMARGIDALPQLVLNEVLGVILHPYDATSSFDPFGSAL